MLLAEYGYLNREQADVRAFNLLRRVYHGRRGLTVQARERVRAAYVQALNMLSAR